MGNSSPKLSDKETYYEAAIKTVDRNINGIWIDSVIKIVLTNIRIRLRIDKGMYKELYETRKDEIDKIHDLHDLIKLLTKEWADQIFKDEKTRKIFIKRIAKEQITQEHANTKTSKAEIEQIASGISEMKTDEYLKRQIELYPRSDSFLNFPVRVNLKIWKSVVDAMLFNVPIEKVLECMQSILEKDYLPTAHMENGFLYISINDLTIQTDVLLAWDRIEEKRNEYKSKYGYLQAERGCKNPNEDRIILGLSDQGLKPKEISKRLHSDFKIELRAIEVSGRLKEIRKRSRASEAKELLLRYGE